MRWRDRCLEGEAPLLWCYLALSPDLAGMSEVLFGVVVTMVVVHVPQSASSRGLHLVLKRGIVVDV